MKSILVCVLGGGPGVEQDSRGGVARFNVYDVKMLTQNVKLSHYFLKLSCYYVMLNPVFCLVWHQCASVCCRTLLTGLNESLSVWWKPISKVYWRHL